MGGRLPEIRDKESYLLIRSRAIKEGIEKILAGVYYDAPTKRFRFISDGADARPNSPFTTFTYGGDYHDVRHEAQWEDDKWLTGMAAKYAIIYNWPQQQFDIRLASQGELGTKVLIMCEKLRDKSQQILSVENNLLIQLTNHACQRDRKSIISSTQYLLHEIEEITNLNITIKERPPNMEDFFPQFVESEAPSRSTRALTETTQTYRDDDNKEEEGQGPLPQQSVYAPTSTASSTDLPFNLKALTWMLQGLRTKGPRSKRSTSIPSYFKAFQTVWKTSQIMGQHNDKFSPWLRFELDTEYRLRMKHWIAYGLAIPLPSDRLVDLPIPTEDTLDKFAAQGISSIEVQRLLDSEDEQAFLSRLQQVLKAALDLYFTDISDGNQSNLQRNQFYVSWPQQSFLWKKWDGLRPRASSIRIQPTTQAPGTTSPTTTTRSSTTAPNHGKRTRRTPFGPLGMGIAAGFGGMAMANSITSAITGDAPLSWAGKALGSIFGLSTGKAEMFEEVTKMAKGMEALKINQEQIVSTVNAMNKRIVIYGELIRGTHQATATITMEQDLKMLIRHMQVIQQVTLAKYANVFLAASVQKTSPYALSQRELEQLANEVKLKRGLHLGRNMADVRTTVAIINNQITILFEVPVMEDNHLFNFFSVTPLPVFSANRTLIPDIDSAYIGISKTGSDYILVSPDQFTRCVAEPATCQVSAPIFPMSAQSSCVITTYMTQKLTCPLLETDRPQEPVLHISGNRTIFSVPKETTLFVKCSEHSFSSKFTEATVTINGMGEAVFRQSCTVNILGGMKFDTPSAPHMQKLSDLNMFELLRIYPIPTDVVIRRMPELPPIPELSLREVQIPSPADMALHTFHPMKSFPFLSQMAILILFVIFVGTLGYCCRHTIRRRIQQCTCGQCCKESDSERQERRSQESEAMLTKLANDFDKLKVEASANVSKWTSGSRLFLANLGKSKSTPDLETFHYTKDDAASCDSLPPPPSPCPSMPIPSARAKSMHYVYRPVISKPILKNVRFPPHVAM
jgi:hypothetical protein